MRVSTTFGMSAPGYPRWKSRRSLLSLRKSLVMVKRNLSWILGGLGVTFGGALLALRLLLPIGGALTLSGCGDDCLERGQNCSQEFLESSGESDLSCCDGLVCCARANGSGVVTCNPSGNCE
ncbi:MAG: hypothetical protein AAFQ65_03230 [Myxococcota bacterium]